MEEENNEIKEQLIVLKEENEHLKKEQNKTENDNNSAETKFFKILDKYEIDNLEKIEELGSGGGGKIVIH